MRGASWIGRLALSTALVCLLGCASEGRTATIAPAPEGRANLVVYLSNQSSARRSVILAVYVDGRLAVRKEMTSVDKLSSHGLPEEFPLCTARGPHTIRVVAEGQVACASTEVVVGAEALHIDAAYLWEPGRGGERRIPEKISISVQTKPFDHR